MSPYFNGRSALQCFECSNVIKIRNGTMFHSTQHCHHKIYDTCEKVWGMKLHKPYIYMHVCSKTKGRWTEKDQILELVKETILHIMLSC